MKNLRLPHQSSITRRPKLSTVGALALLSCFLIAYLLPNTHAQNEAAAIPQASTPKDKGAEFVPGELLVRFRPGTSLARNKARASVSVSVAAGRIVAVDLDHFGGSELVHGLMLARVAPEETLTTLKALRARPDVEYAEPNFIRHADNVPNDPRYPDLYALKNAAPGAAGISAEAAWDTTTGNQSVVVGVIDSGIDIEHRDLKDNIWVNPGEIAGNNIDDDSNGFVDDVNGWDFVHNDRTVFDSANEDFHATHVAGTIGARGNNAIGVVGVNWNVQIMSLKALGLTGSPDSSLLNAYNYAKMMRQRGVNLRVLNNSYGGQQFSESLMNGIKELANAGILFVASAGNETLNNDFVPHFPSSFDLPNIISVAASNESGFLASQFTNRGQKSVHLAAPGQAILSTTPRGFTGAGLLSQYTEADGSTYSLFNGTSMAAPHVTGAAALACVVNPGITLEKLRAAVLFGVDESSAFFGAVSTRGRLNVNKTLQFAVENDTTAPAPAQNFSVNSLNGRVAQLFWTDTGDDGMTGQASLREIFFTDADTNERFLLHLDRPGSPGTGASMPVSIPIRHTNGQLSMRFYDNVGNTSTASVNVTVASDVADPYIVTTGPPGTLTAPNSGTLVGVRGDDITSFVGLPFPFPFFGDLRGSVVMSTNGALYVPMPPDFAVPNPSFGPFDFAVATEPNLENLAMIAGMWCDIRTDRNATDGVYMVQPDLDTVIFRWQGVTFGAETPVNFEIELRRDGAIQTRYGSGNANLTPVIVGISGGDPDAYFVSSHSSPNGPALSLTNAQSVTFALKNPPPPPAADLSIRVTGNPTPVISGQNITYMVSVQNLGPNPADLVVMTDVLPPGTTFISCNSSHFAATCTNSGSTVTGRINTLQPVQFGSDLNFTIVAKVDAAPGAALQNNPSVTGFRTDPNPANNSATVTNHVVAESFFSNARAISAGNSHTTAAKTDGTVWNWGSGFRGTLGDGSGGIGVHAVAPVQVLGLSGVQQVKDGGSGFVYALKSDGTVWAWGINNSAQLGDGTTIDRGFPVQTVGLTNVVGIAAGAFYGAAVKSDGTVWVWGDVGPIIGGSSSQTTPVQMAGIQNVAAIAAGSRHLLMVKTDKTLWAIGSNLSGQLGDGTTTPRITPVQITSVTNVARIAGGEEFSMVRKEDGTIWAWGLHGNGQLGPGGGTMDFFAHPNPVQVTGLPGAMTEIAAGSNWCLAVASDGTVWSWGNNGSGQLGQGPQITQNPTPHQIPNFGNVAAVAGGFHHSVAMKTDGSVWTWGSNNEGALGDTTLENRLAPVRVTGLETVTAPSISPPGGLFNLFVDVTITCATPGATIHYSKTGNDPTESDPVIASGATLRLTSNTSLRVRAWKGGLVPSSVIATFYEVIPAPPNLLLEENGPVSTQLVALDSGLLLRDPFPIVNAENWLKNPGDPNTRVIVFATNIQLGQFEPPGVVQITLTDSANFVHFLQAEDVRPIAGTDFTQVIFRLPNNLASGTCQVRLFYRQNSNAGTIRIK